MVKQQGGVSSSAPLDLLPMMDADDLLAGFDMSSLLDDFCRDENSFLKLDPWSQLDGLTNDSSPSTSDDSAQPSPSYSGDHSPAGSEISFPHSQVTNGVVPQEPVRPIKRECASVEPIQLQAASPAQLVVLMTGNGVIQSSTSATLPSVSAPVISSKNARLLSQPYPQIRPKLKAELSFDSPAKMVYAPQQQPSQPTFPVAPVPSQPTTAGSMYNKREQRKIRNREAAQQSRQRRKEFVESIKEQLDYCSLENERLKRENCSLREKMQALESENQMLKRGQNTFSTDFRTSALAKTTGVCLFALMMLFVFNTGSLFSRFAPSDLTRPQPINYEMSGFHSRSLMSFEDNSQWSDTERIDLDEVHREANKPQTAKADNLTDDCRKLVVNRTESLRLNDELNSWVKNYQKNPFVKSKESRRPEPKKRVRAKSAEGGKEKDPNDFLSTYRNSKVVMGPRLSSYYSNRHKFDLQPYATPEVRYAQLVDALQRKDDTFYLVSFKDYLLLPATAHNSTVRPRLSLVVPTLPVNQSTTDLHPGHVAMMRIECEVTNTGLLYLPQQLLTAPTVTKTNATGEQ